MKLVISDHAEADLRSIIRFAADRWGIERARTYVAALRDKLELLRGHSFLGPAAKEVSVGLRRYSYLSHHIFYRVDAGGIRVIRILHKRMQPDQHLP